MRRLILNNIVHHHCHQGSSCRQSNQAPLDLIRCHVTPLPWKMKKLLMLAWQPPMVMALVMIRINFDYHPHGGLIPLMNIMFGNPMPNQCLGYSLVQVVLLARRCSYSSNKYLLSFWTISSFPADVRTESQWWCYVFVSKSSMSSSP